MSASSTSRVGRAVTVPAARALAAGVAALAGAAVILSPSVAHAEPNLGTLLLTPAAGTVEDALRMTTSAPCPPGADVSQARIYGPGFKASGQNLSGMAPGFTSSKTAFSVESQYTLRDTAALTYPPVTYQGTYRITVICRTSKSSTLFGAFTTAITFKDAVNWVTASDPSVPVSGGPTTSLPPASQKPASQKPASAKPTATKSATASPRATPSAGASGTSDPTSGSTGATPSSAVADGATTPVPSGTSEAGSEALAGDAASTSGSANALGAALLGAVGGAALLGGGLYLVNRRRSS